MKRLLVVSLLVFLVGFIGNVYAPDVQKIPVYVDVSTADIYQNRSYVNVYQCFLGICS